ncbi:MAG TPA: NYN domain-containing protein [Candidatus Woesebacteria bacterium]|nr:NYN domain-containing protein [Candidatus Woesebacteria bacterium]
MKTNKSIKIYTFIDSQNLNLGIQNQGWRLDFKKFRIYLEEKYNIDKAFIFIGYLQSNNKLYTFLKRSGYELIFKPTVIDNEGKSKGNVDAELVLYAAKIEFDNYDKAIIVSGDGDFYCLIKFLRQQNKLRNIIIPNHKRYSKLLIPFKKYLRFTNDLKNKLEKRQ